MTGYICAACGHEMAPGPGWTKACPDCGQDVHAGGHARVGRCRSGRRWFWAATSLWYGRDEQEFSHGWEDTEAASLAAAVACGFRLLHGEGWISVRHGQAGWELKKVNAANRAARVSDATDAQPVEYLYYISHGDEGPADVRSCLITKKTAKRVYFLLGHERTCFVDRQELAREGEVYHRGGWPHTFYAQPPELRSWGRPAEVDKADKEHIRRLRLAAADAHPDRGGTNETFIAAHRAYEQARRAAEMR